VIASCLGEPRHPAWWLNLEADPEAEVLVAGRREKVRATKVEGPEREKLWDMVVAANADYAEYATRTTRRIPVVRLSPS
jgi:deazaflavin-dependent oxidoreductase (nitroreductase family)